MKYKEALCYLDDGCMIRSKESEYKIINDVMCWRWIGEESWIPLINTEELADEWEVIAD
jgi:hypothetical protein